MSKYLVTIPIAGALHIEVEAEDPEAAKKAAWNKFGDEGPEAGEVEWDAFDTLVNGNTCSAPFNTIEVTKS